MVNFKMYDVTDWTTNNYNTHITQYLKKWDIAWEIFLFKNHAKNEVGGLVPDLFLFFNTALRKVKESGQYLSFDVSW